MSLITKLITLIRGKSHEAGQAVVDANAITIVEQELRDAAKELDTSRSELTKIMANSKLIQKEIDERTGKLAEHSRNMTVLMGKTGHDDLKLEVAGKIAELEGQQKQAQSLKASLDGKIAELKSTINKSEARLRSTRTQLQNIKATDSVQKAQLALSSSHAGANAGMSNALDSLKRIEQRQAERGARIEASAELEASSGEADLAKRLAAAGVTSGDSDALAVLARFQQPAQIAHEPTQVQVLSESPDRVKAGGDNSA